MDVDHYSTSPDFLSAAEPGGPAPPLSMAGKFVTMDLALYLQRDGAYSRRPDLLRRVRTPFAPLDDRGVLFPTVQIGDLTGDGWADLLTADPIHVTVEVPTDERNAVLADLDQDVRNDVVIHYPSSTGVNRVAVLMARKPSSLAWSDSAYCRR